MKRVPIVKEVGGKRRAFFYDLNETEEKIYRELQWLRDFIDIEELKKRINNPRKFDSAISRLCSLQFVSIMDFGEGKMAISNC